jgi:hypothetical protein
MPWRNRPVEELDELKKIRENLEDHVRTEIRSILGDLARKGLSTEYETKVTLMEALQLLRLRLRQAQNTKDQTQWNTSSSES